MKTQVPSTTPDLDGVWRRSSPTQTTSVERVPARSCDFSGSFLCAITVASRTVHRTPPGGSGAFLSRAWVHRGYSGCSTTEMSCIPGTTRRTFGTGSAARQTHTPATGERSKALADADSDLPRRWSKAQVPRQPCARPWNATSGQDCASCRCGVSLQTSVFRRSNGCATLVRSRRRRNHLSLLKEQRWENALLGRGRGRGRNPEHD